MNAPKNVNKRISGLYFLIPVFYISIIILLIYLQLSEKVPIDEKIGIFTITGIRSNTGIEELTVKSEHIDFFFTKQNPLTLETQGEELPLKIESYQSYVDGLEISFEQGCSLRFSYDHTAHKTLRVDPYFHPTVAGQVFLSVFFGVTNRKATEVTGIPVVALKGNTGTFFLSVANDSYIDLPHGRISILYRERNGILVESAPQESDNPYLYWFSKQLEPLGENEYRSTIMAYIDQAYLGWTKNRLTANASQWQLVDESAFDEGVGAAMLSESLRRKQYINIITLFARALENYSKTQPNSALPYLTSAYLGSLVQFINNKQDRDTKIRETVKQALINGDSSVFLIKDLSRFILNHAPFSLTDEIITLAEGLNYQNEPIDVCIGIIDTLLQMPLLIEGRNYCPPKCIEIVYNKILPNLTFTDNNRILLIGGENRADLNLTIQGGLLLARIGDTIQQDDLVQMGRSMVLSALSFADANGFIPKLIPLERYEVDDIPHDYITPESLYDILVQETLSDSYYPREIPLYPHLTPGTWLWTAAQVDSIDITNRQYLISLKFPTNYYHYVVIRGIEPFREIRLHGIVWRSDIRYFNWNDGWVYDNLSRTLYLKLTHRLNKETIAIFY